jgi:hypothetical protein
MNFTGCFQNSTALANKEDLKMQQPLDSRRNLLSCSRNCSGQSIQEQRGTTVFNNEAANHSI